MVLAAKDPYRYFRIEARELLAALSDGVLQLEKGPSAPEAISRLLRFAHTLKGAARVVKLPAIAELAHAIEGLLADEREGKRPLAHAQASQLLSLCDQIGAQLLLLEAPPASSSAAAPAAIESIAPAEPAQPPPPRSIDEQFQTVRIEIEEMDRLLGGVAEAGVQLGALRRDLAAVDRLGELGAGLLGLLKETGDAGGEHGAQAMRSTLVRARAVAEEQAARIAQLQRELATDLERSERGLIGVRDLAQRLRLLPANAIFPSLERAVRDAALATKKRARLVTSGGEVRLDASMLAALRDALLHVVRNAVAHGIESERERLAAKKPGEGSVQLEVQRRGNRAVFLCRDDGRGVDVEAVRRAAVARGLLSESRAAALPLEELFDLLLTGGLTTSGELTEISGRGIGLDVVRETAARLKGSVTIRSQPGQGMELELAVPISISSLTGLLVESAGEKVAIPLDSVRETLRLGFADLVRSPEGESLLHQGEVIPFLTLDRALGRAAEKKIERRENQAFSAVIVHASGRTAALGVDRCCGAESIVARALPSGVVADPIVAGASLDAEGNPQLVLDPEAIVAMAARGRGAASEAKAQERPPVLVIDDSLTTRMLEQSILESAGYQVEVAVSAEEGMAKARARKYALFLVDVEMPGMDGFEFVTRTRSDPQLSQVPAILVTSRNAPEDKQRGLEAGASAYVVKGEFDQRELMQTIRFLIG